MVKAVFHIHYAIKWILGFAYMQVLGPVIAMFVLKTSKDEYEITVISKLKIKPVYFLKIF